ncbi:MAG: hypothetical protein A3K19_11850 [Lentisphaerae bacterium RIFOXYB12_FULL_65_16]|nr:MAG: hypothetical protein A3K18_23320 [Lentisphaerae bacterium RIFOXYA12_64_32]OGV88004.1 MAG: hypothetical protein A3K19_11850 [Lentisphaerae bacterium RIFOXYB12_FULL_65_16]
MVCSEDAMKLYMKLVSQHPLITREEEVQLALEVRKGSETARHKLIRSNLRLVVKIAHDFTSRGLPLMDLISEGNIGLVRAVEKFDPAKGAKLSSYAAWWIKQGMRRALANQGRTIRIPVQSATKIARIHATRARLRDQLGREPTDAETASSAHLSTRTVAGLGCVKVTAISLDAPLQEGETGEFQGVIPDESVPVPDKTACDAEMRCRMLMLVDGLDQRERTILTLRFGLNGAPPRTLDEVSRVVRRTRERIRQIQNTALAKLHALLEEDPSTGVHLAFQSDLQSSERNPRVQIRREQPLVQRPKYRDGAPNTYGSPNSLLHA